MSWWRRKSIKHLLLCDCSSTPTNGGSSYEVSLQGGHCTAFWAGKCKKCGGYWGFPSENFLLAVLEGTAETLKLLKNAGIPVDAIAESKGGKSER